MIDTTKLKEIMKAGRWNSTNLAEASSVNQFTVWRIVSGRHIPRADTLQKICTALGIAVTDILIDETEKAAA